MLTTKFRSAFFVGSFILTILLATLILKSGNQNLVAPAKRIFLKEGFDFRQLRSLNPNLSAPQIGAKVNAPHA